MGNGNDLDAMDADLRRKSRIYDSIARSLGVQIISGALQPGHVFNTEILASDHLNVSRAAYRDALRILKAKGLVEAKPKAGTRVTEMSSWNFLDPDVLQWIFVSDPSSELIYFLFELRSIVEPKAAALAATRRTDEQLDGMRNALKQMERHTLSTEAGRAADQRFHSALLEASRNPFVISLSSSVGAAIAWTTIYKTRANILRRDPVPDHWTVFHAVASSDPYAAHAAMKQLVDQALADTLPIKEQDARLI